MSSFREVESTVNYRSDDKSLDGSHYRQRRYGRKFLRSLERQISDKHLKRRTQIELESNSNSNSNHSSNRLSYHRQYPGSINVSSLSLNDMHHVYENQNQHYRRSDLGGHFPFDNIKRGSFRKMLLLALIILTLIFGINVYFTLKLSGMSEKAKIPFIISGESMKNEFESGEMKDLNRSYQDLANTIKMLRDRRHVIVEEKGDRKERKDVNGGEGGNHEDDDRLKRLEQKIQMEQSRKVREEFLLSNKKSHSDDTSGQNADENSKRHLQHEQQDVHHKSATTNTTDTTTLKEKLMSDNIAALKLLNDEKKKKESV